MGGSPMSSPWHAGARVSSSPSSPTSPAIAMGSAASVTAAPQDAVKRSERVTTLEVDDVMIAQARRLTSDQKKRSSRVTSLEADDLLETTTMTMLEEGDEDSDFEQ
eukprot:Skav204533  [mRNA]  locus=scaffold1211:145058:147040:- [translate_table: standard]